MITNPIIRLVIPGRLPTLNRALRKHWAVRHREQRAWDLEVLAAMSPRRRPADATEPRHVTIRQFRHALLDPDNLVAAVKPLLDALRHNRLLKNDSARWCALDAGFQQRVPRRQAEWIEVEIIPVNQ